MPGPGQYFHGVSDQPPSPRQVKAHSFGRACRLDASGTEVSCACPSAGASSICTVHRSDTFARCGANISWLSPVLDHLWPTSVLQTAVQAYSCMLWLASNRLLQPGNLEVLFPFHCLLHEAMLELEQCCIRDSLYCSLLAGPQEGQCICFVGVRRLCKGAPIGDLVRAQVFLLTDQQRNSIANHGNVGPLTECGVSDSCSKHMAWHSSLQRHCLMRQPQLSSHMKHPTSWSPVLRCLQSKEDASPEMLALPSTLSQAAGTRFAARPLPHRSSSAPLWAPSPEPEDVPASLQPPSESPQFVGW